MILQKFFSLSLYGIGPVLPCTKVNLFPASSQPTIKQDFRGQSYLQLWYV